MAPVKPRGPAAAHESSLHPSNPYNFPPGLWHAGKLPPKVTDKYVYFFGYEGEDPHVCLQQWFPAPFKTPKPLFGNQRQKSESSSLELEFPTTEHYMMYCKAVLFGDTEIANKIYESTHPSQAKKCGREVKNFELNKWTAECDHIVEDANYYKFSQNDDLKAVLLGTGDKVIVEASPDDKIWGIGFNSEDAEGHEADWGNNGLGKALMRVRERLREGT